MITFEAFPKIPRLNREMVITEKIDGTNACIIVSDDGLEIGAASRNKLITPTDDNHGFAKFVEANKTELLPMLGPGRHFGEWWGAGINKRYSKQGLQSPKTFSLFDTARWTVENCPKCCSVVPTLYKGPFDTAAIQEALGHLAEGSVAAPGFSAEGIVIYHVAANTYFKVTFEKDELPKSTVVSLG